MSRPRVMIRSGAFPDSMEQVECSAVHHLLRDAIKVDEEVTLRKFKQSDLEHLKKLFKQWFPINYGESFYNKIKNREVECWVATCKIVTKKHTDLEIIIGSIVYGQSQADLSILAASSILSYVSNQFQSIYIMSLGVIDEFRGKRVASQLLSKVFEQVDKEPAIKYVDLHVISHNSATAFYEKKDFQKFALLSNYYHIAGNQYDAVHFVRFTNGGTKRKGWLEWLLSFVR